MVRAITVLILVHLTPLTTVQIYFAMHLTELIKWIIGIILVEKGIWLNDITTKETKDEAL